MNQFFRVLCLLLAALLLLSACNNGTSRGDDTAATTTTKGKETTGMKTENTTSGENAPVPVKNPILLANMVIVRPQTSDSLVVYAARTVSRAIGEKIDGGVAPSVTIDLHDENVPEILVGETNRTATAEAKALLGSERFAFAIRRSGNRLAVVGTTDEMTCYGVEYLIREIVPAYVSGTAIALEEDFCYIGTSETVALVSGGKTSYRVSASSAAMGTALMMNAQTICKAFKTVTGSNAVYFEDTGSRTYNRDSSATEILVGSTYHPETYSVFSRLTYQEGVVAIEGNKIIVFGFTEAALASATELFCNLVTRYTDGKNVTLPAKLFLRVNDQNVKVTAPIYPSPIQKLVPVDGEGMMIYLPKTNETEFNSYASMLQTKGYENYAENQLGYSQFYTYTKGRNVINGGFDPVESIARVVLELPGAKLPAQETFDPEEDDICTPLLTQVDLNNLECQSGMSYVIRLRDGRFLVVDGGATDYDEAKQLCDLLTAQNVRGGKPTIAAWFLTHAHGDHWQAFLEMAESYASKVVIQSVVINTATPELFSVNFDTASKTTILSKIKGISGVKIIYARTGQQFRFAEATVDVWLTPEDLYIGSSNISSGNDASVIYRLSCEGQTTMFLADAEAGIADYMVKRYGNAMKSDIMQIPHHGYSYSDHMPPLFACVDPDVVLWPSVDHWYHYFLTYSNNLALVASAKEIIPACHGTRELALPYTALPKAERYYNDGDVIYSQDFESVRNVYEIGWQMSDDLNGSYTTPSLTLSKVNGDKGLLMTGKSNCSTLSFLCRDHLKNVSTYTVTMDLRVYTLGDGFQIWYHDAEPMHAGNRAIFNVEETGTFTLKLVINRGPGGTTTAYVDGSEVGTYINESNDLGPLIFILKKANVFVGKVEVTAGAN